MNYPKNTKKRPNSYTKPRTTPSPTPYNPFPDPENPKNLESNRIPAKPNKTQMQK